MVIDTQRPLSRRGPGNGRLETALGATEVSLSRVGSTIVGPAEARLRPERPSITAIDRSTDRESKTVVASTGITTRSIGAADRKGVGGEGVGAIGGRVAGRMAQIRLQAADSRTHPETGVRGDLYVDRQGRLWFCRGGRDDIQLA